MRCAASEISLEHGRVAAHGLESPLGYLDAVVQSDDAIADAADEFHVVFDEENGDTAVTDASDVAHQLARLRGVHPRGGLVEKKEAWHRRQRPSDLKAPAVGVG